MTSDNEGKLQRVLDILESNSDAKIHFDARVPGVIVPPHLASLPDLMLQIGMSMVVPIPDLVMSSEGFSCTLSFNRTPNWVSVPWDAVYIVTNSAGEGMLWPHSAPAEYTARPHSVPSPTGTIDLMSRRKPAERAACERRLSKAN